MGRVAMPAPERVLARVVESDTWFQGEPCWIFTGCLDRHGYGKVSVGSRKDGTDGHALTHRVMYESRVGPVPHGLTLDHLCRVRSCCNPAHLEPVSQAENVRRGQSFAAGFASRTHCVNGHAFDDRNTYIPPSGGRRICRTCNRENVRKYANGKGTK